MTSWKTALCLWLCYVCYSVQAVQRKTREPNTMFSTPQQIVDPVEKEFFQQFQYLGLSSEAMHALLMLGLMFRNPATVLQALPPGVPPTTPTYLAGLISRVFAETPELDKSKLERVLKIWRMQLMNSPQFFQTSSSKAAKPISGNLVQQDIMDNDVTTATDAPNAQGNPVGFRPYAFPQLPDLYRLNS